MNSSDESPQREAALAFLLSRVDYERASQISCHQREFRLDRMRELLERLDNPQNRLQIVHVAGTKGKGSTSAMIAAALSAAGYRTGLYTSPHLDRLEERIMLDGRPCTGEELAALVDQIRPIVTQLDADSRFDIGPTYFEITTALALLHFAAVKTDFAVVEVGLGGRLDSTNVCMPLVSVITSISFDHMKQLGNTLAAIAREKAGIIKPGVPVVSGVVKDEPRQVIEEVAALLHAPLRQADVDFTYQYTPPRNLDAPPESAIAGGMDFHNHLPAQQHSLAGVVLGLLGHHQAANAAVALATLDELRSQGFAIPESAVRRGLAELRWPARVEIVSRRPTIVIDAAHNTDSIQSLIDTLTESFSSRRRILVFGTTQEKDVAGMLRLLLPQFDEVVFTRYLNNPRAVAIEELDALAGQLSPVPRILCPDPQAAWNHVRAGATADQLICVTGSFFLASEMRLEIARHPIALTESATAQ